MKSRSGGADRISTKAKLAEQLVVLGKVLVRARERNGVRQQEVAARLNLPPSYLSKTEKGARRLDVIEFLRICAAIGADPREVIGELDEELRREPESR